MVWNQKYSALLVLTGLQTLALTPLDSAARCYIWPSERQDDAGVLNAWSEYVLLVGIH